MNLEPLHATPKTIEAIYQHYKDKRKNEHRPHLGGSQIGNPNAAVRLWYQFQTCVDASTFEGRLLRLFETGDREEDRVVCEPSSGWRDGLGARSRDWQAGQVRRLWWTFCTELGWRW